MPLSPWSMRFARSTLRAIIVGAFLCSAGLAGAKPFVIVLPYTTPPPVPDSIIELADKLGFYKQTGVDVQFLHVIQTPSALASMKSGAADMANVATGSVLELIARGQMKLRGVISSDKALPFVIAAKKQYSSIAQLAGKSFGVASVGSTDYSVSRVVLSKLGIDLGSMQFVALGAPQVRAQALLAGRIDSTAFSIGVWTSIEDKSKVGLLLDQEAYYAAAPYVTQLDVVTEETARNRSAEVAAVVRALILASRAVAKDPSIWVEAMVQARPDMKREDLIEIAKSYRHSWSVNGGLNLSNIGLTTDMLYQAPDMKDLARIHPADWVDTHFVDNVLADIGVDSNMDSTGR